MNQNDLIQRIRKDFEDLIKILDKTCDKDERGTVTLAKMAFKAFKFFQMGYWFKVNKI